MEALWERRELVVRPERPSVGGRAGSRHREEGSASDGTAVERHGGLTGTLELSTVSASGGHADAVVLVTMLQSRVVQAVGARF